MSKGHTGVALRQLQILLCQGTTAGLPDRQLLEQFADRRDATAFAALVERHGPMVLGVCRRILRDPYAVEDAFQAAFLVLVRKAGSIHVDDSLGGWLYTVTRRIALRARANAARREAISASSEQSLPADVSDRAERHELQVALHEELGRLPESYRTAVVLCYLEGLSHEETARRLGWPLGTVKGRLGRARELLRARMIRKGFALPVGALAVSLRPSSVSAALVDKTVSAAIGFAVGQATTTGSFSVAAALATGVLRTMLMTKVKLAAVVLLTVGVGAYVTGAGVLHLPGVSVRSAHADEETRRARPKSHPVVESREAGASTASDAAGSPQDSMGLHLFQQLKTIETEANHEREKLERARHEIKQLELKLGQLDGTKAALEAKLRMALGYQPASGTEKPERPLPNRNQDRVALDEIRRARFDAERPAVEGAKKALPTYVVEPPDEIIVDVLEALPGRPIKGERLVRPDGTISLGYYGQVYVAGLTLSEIKEKIIQHLRKDLSDETLGLVKSDGGASTRIAPKDSVRVFVEVTAYNSKAYYVQGEVAAPGRMPITGNETVLDAINYAGGLIAPAAAQGIRLVRPAPPGACCEQVLPVDLPAIVKRGDRTTNYQLFPGDRVVVESAPSSPSTTSPHQQQIESRINEMIKELEALKRELDK